MLTLSLLVLSLLLLERLSGFAGKARPACLSVAAIRKKRHVSPTTH